MSILTAEDRDTLYTECCRAVSAAVEQAGQEAESLFLARLALLLFEEVGDVDRCRRALAAALRNLEPPRLSARVNAQA